MYRWEKFLKSFYRSSMLSEKFSVRNGRRNKIYGRSSLPPNFSRISVRKLGRKYLRSPNNTRHATQYFLSERKNHLPLYGGEVDDDMRNFIVFFPVPRFKILTRQKFLPPHGKVISGTVVFVEVIYRWVPKERRDASGLYLTSTDVPTP